jgi:hypothetical protein
VCRKRKNYAGRFVELMQICGAVDAVKLQVGGCRKRKNYAGSENYSPH